MPTLKSLMLHMWDRGRMYLQKAGTIILFTSILLYVCNTFPVKKEFVRDYDKEIAKIEQTAGMTKEAKEESIGALENTCQKLAIYC